VPSFALSSDILTVKTHACFDKPVGNGFRHREVVGRGLASFGACAWLWYSQQLPDTTLHTWLGNMQQYGMIDEVGVPDSPASNILQRSSLQVSMMELMVLQHLIWHHQ
jgi:hypothetical protein